MVDGKPDINKEDDEMSKRYCEYMAISQRMDINEKNDEINKRRYEYIAMSQNILRSMDESWHIPAGRNSEEDIAALKEYFAELIPKKLGFSYSFHDYISPTTVHHQFINEAFGEAQKEFKCFLLAEFNEKMWEYYYHNIPMDSFSTRANLDLGLMECIAKSVHSAGDDVQRFEYADHFLYDELQDFFSHAFESYWSIRKLETYRLNFALKNQEFPELIAFRVYPSEYDVCIRDFDLADLIHDEFLDKSKDSRIGVVKPLLTELCRYMDRCLYLRSPIKFRSSVDSIHTFLIEEESSIQEMRKESKREGKEFDDSEIKSRIRKAIDTKFLEACEEVKQIVSDHYSKFRTNLDLYQKDCFPSLEYSESLSIQDGDSIESQQAISGLLQNDIQSIMNAHPIESAVSASRVPNSSLHNSGVESEINLENQRG